jgi:tetratricopeptide (TPR) repeat protein
LRTVVHRTFGLVLLAAVAAAQPQTSEPQSRITLASHEPLFAVMAAVNACGYDAELASSTPLREQVRKEVSSAILGSYEAIVAKDDFCKLYKAKQQPDSARDLAQYVSLGINLGGSPFALAMKEADLPPDALALVQAGVIPLLQKLYDKAQLHSIWERVQPQYEAQIEALHRPVADMIFNTDLYLRLPMSNYLGRKFVVYVEPLAAPGQVNARNYGDDYFVVISPAPNAPAKIEQVRHTYLHYILDPLALKRANAIKRIEPILETVAKAPLDENYKHDPALMLLESLVRAIEARTLPVSSRDQRTVEAARSSAAQAAMEQGFVLTRYFYEALAGFEKGETGFRDSFGDLLVRLDVDRERKRASAVRFRTEGTSELVQASNRPRRTQLDQAEVLLARGDAQGAQRIAQQVLEQKSEDPARALMILGKTAATKKDVDNAQSLFQRALEIAKEPRTVAWSHIYLARILDLRCQRETALTHYRAALAAGDEGVDTKAAADRGLAASPPGCDAEKN